MKKGLLCVALLCTSMCVGAKPQEGANQLKAKNMEYLLAIQEHVTSKWNRPPTNKANFRCKLKAIQARGGEVISVTFDGVCNADEDTRQSMIDAVKNAGPLPYSGYEEVFEKEITLIFNYSND